jgi:hypothetical protein
VPKRETRTVLAWIIQAFEITVWKDSSVEEPQKIEDVAGALLALLLLALLVTVADAGMQRTPVPVPLPPTLRQRTRRLAARLRAALSPAIPAPPVPQEVP